MTCPRCNKAETAVRRTQGAKGRVLPNDLLHLNILRRRRFCSKCGYRFFTIELLESEFDILRKLVHQAEVVDDAI